MASTALEETEGSREIWLRHEVANRLRGLQADPSKGVPADTVFTQLEGRYRSGQEKATDRQA